MIRSHAVTTAPVCTREQQVASVCAAGDAAAHITHPGAVAGVIKGPKYAWYNACL